MADEADKSLGKGKDESRAKKAPAKKKSRVRKLSSSSTDNGSSSGSSISSDSGSSGSEDEAIGEDTILDGSDEEQLRVLTKKEAARKREKRREKEKEKQRVVKGVKVLSAIADKTREAGKEAEKKEAEQQEKEAAEAGRPEADLTETGRREHSEEQSEDEEDKKRIVRYQTVKERLGSPAPPAAGETSAAAAENTHRLSLLAGYTIPGAVSPIPKCYFESLPKTLDGCIIRAPETLQEKLLFWILADAGMLLSGKRADSIERGSRGSWRWWWPS